MKSAMNLHVERLEKPSAISFDVRPQAVKNWVDALPMGHVGEATRQIFTALRETNGLDIDPKLRFDLLESLWAPVHSILPALFRHFSGNQFPLPKKAQKVAQLSTDLLVEFLVAYRLALEARENSSWFGRKAQKKQKATCAHRLLHYFNGVLENYNVLNLVAPKGLWREVHRVYVEAVQMDWLEEPVTLPDGSAGGTIDQVYKQILLLSLLPPHLLRPDQQQSVRRSLDVWITDLRLPDAARGDDGSAPFCVMLTMDMPPIPNDARCRKLRTERVSAVLFDSSRIRKRIEGHLAGSAPAVGIGDATVSTDTLGVLLRSWGEPPNRVEERTAQRFEVQMAISLSAVHYLMRLQSGAVTRRESGGPALVEHIDLGPVSEEIELSTFGSGKVDKPRIAVKKGEFISSNEHNDNTWGQIFDQTPKPADWTEASNEKEYSAITAQVHDASEHGYRVSLPVRDVEQLKVGDLTGVFEATLNEWRIGSTRWVRQEDEEELQVGIQVHMGAAIPVDVRVRHDGGESAPQRCLIGLEHGEAPLIVLPALPGIADKRLVLADSAVEAGLKLREKVAGSAIFEIYRFEVTGAKQVGNIHRCPELVLSLVQRYLPDEQPAPEAIRSSEDEYSNIWSTL